MAHFTGQNLYVAFGGVDCSADQRTLSWNESANTADTTAGADVDESHLITTEAVDFSITILAESTSAGSAVLAALKNGLSGTLEIGTLGTASGNPKYSCLASVTGVTHNTEYNSEVTIDVSLLRSGSWITHWTELGSTY